MQPAIVISAFNRPGALARLLSSLQRADYPKGVQIPLIVSIDASQGPAHIQVRDEAQGFKWQHGPLEVVLHERHLGPLENFYYCGGLTHQYESVIFLEDDLVVSPVFYYFGVQALEAVADQAHVGGVSLYTYAFNGYTHYPFVPIADGGDNFFMQVPSILGQAWTSAQWALFTKWRTNSTKSSITLKDQLHPFWSQFDRDDYFPILTKYLVATDQFTIFPRSSHTTGFGDVGVHFTSTTAYYQVPLQRRQKTYRFNDLETAFAVYDSFHEILPERLKRLAVEIRDFDFDVDLNATKSQRHLGAEYVLTSRICKNPRQTFAQAMWPLEANVIENIPGSGLSLCRPEHIRWGRLADIKTRNRLDTYFTRGRRMSRSLRFQFALLEFVESIQRRLKK